MMIFKEAYKEAINEASNTIELFVVKNNKEVQNLIHNFRTDDDQKKLRDIIFESLGLDKKTQKYILDKIKKSKIEEVKNFEEFVKVYNSKFFGNDILPYIAKFIGMAPNSKGYGKGELFMAFLHPYIIINGGSGSFDLSLNGDEAELKEVKFKVKDNNGILYNFKFGTENASKEAQIRSLAQKYIKQYLLHIPKDKWPDNAEEKLAKGELNALISLVKKYENKIKPPKNIDVIIDSEGNVYLDNNKIGNIFDPTFTQIIKRLFDNSETLKWKDIVDKTKELFGKSNRSYVFIVGQTNTMKNLGKMCYKTKLGKDVIPLDFTQGKVKIGVICNELPK